MAKDKPQPQTGPEIEEYSTTATPKAYAGSVPVFCAHDAIVPLKDLRPNPSAAGSSQRATAVSWPRSSTT